ncbi:hypothetical protein GIB67_026481 [Kingdonia uniflora]|uniref:Major facilitator superfamily (MFS) profile domain-containing protein n=1 Tax=Kingdonia uniflora TaxID=39325 RepID=A0A7J7P6P2_9MAGN|nr:hypothetical protein GIB67_026481 [Kingdonia uniflora]
MIWMLLTIISLIKQVGNGGPMFTIGKALASMGFENFQGLVLVFAGMGWVLEAMEIMLLSFVGSAVQSMWGLSSCQESFIASIVFAGMLVGAYLWGVVSDNHGRRKEFLIPVIVMFVDSFLSVFSSNYASLLILRCLVGAGLGAYHAKVGVEVTTCIVIFAVFSLLVFYSVTPELPSLALLTSELVHPSRQCGSTSLHLQNSQDTIPYRNMFLTSLAELPRLLLAALIMDRLGQKVSMLTIFFLSYIFLLPLVIHQPESLTNELLFGSRICITGESTVAFFMLPRLVLHSQLIWVY